MVLSDCTTLSQSTSFYNLVRLIDTVLELLTLFTKFLFYWIIILSNHWFSATSP